MTAEINGDLFALEHELFSAMRNLCPHQPAIDRAKGSTKGDRFPLFVNILVVHVALGYLPRSELDTDFESIARTLSLPIEALNAYVNFKCAIAQYARLSESLSDSWLTSDVL